MSYNSARPYLACFVFLRRGGKLAFLLRSGTDWMNGYYGLPAGKIEVDEPLLSGAVREVQEEVGVDVLESDLRMVFMAHRKSDDDTLAWIDVYFEADTWGGEPFNAEPHKHSELVWLDPNDLPKNIVPSVRFALKHIAAGHQYGEFGWVKDEQ